MNFLNFLIINLLLVVVSISCMEKKNEANQFSNESESKKQNEKNHKTANLPVKISAIRKAYPDINFVDSTSQENNNLFLLHFYESTGRIVESFVFDSRDSVLDQYAYMDPYIGGVQFFITYDKDMNITEQKGDQMSFGIMPNHGCVSDKDTIRIQIYAVTPPFSKTTVNFYYNVNGKMKKSKTEYEAKSDRSVNYFFTPWDSLNQTMVTTTIQSEFTSDTIRDSIYVSFKLCD